MIGLWFGKIGLNAYLMECLENNGKWDLNDYSGDLVDWIFYKTHFGLKGVFRVYKYGFRRIDFKRVILNN